MADYYPLLAKAVAALPNSTPEARRAIYERARTALIGQLRRMEPPVPEADLDREAEALEAAVARIEAEFEPPPADIGTHAEPPAEAVPRDPAAMAGLARPAPPAEAPTAPPPAPEPPASPPPAAEASPPPPAAERNDQRPSASSPTRREPRRPAAPSPNGGAAPRWPKAPNFPVPPQSKSRRNGVATLGAQPESLPPEGVNKTPVAEGLEVKPTRRDELAAREADAEQSIPSEPNAEAQNPPGAETARIRLDAQRPFAPQPARAASAPGKRLWIVGAIVGLVVLLVAVAAFKLRDRPEDLASLRQTAASSAQTEAASSGKIADRIGGSSDSQQRSGNAASAAATQKDVPRGEEEQASALAPVSSRAALLVEAPEEQSKVKTYLGSVVWRVDNVSSGPDAPLTMAVHADVDIPEEKMQAAMSFQKNFDATLPASHTMKLDFATPPGGPFPDVQQINVPQMRRENAATGEALSGVPVPVTQNSFLVGLNRGKAEAANLDLLRTREWIDVPILLSNGRVAKLTFEKGVAGQRALDDALASWQAQPPQQ